MTRFLLTADRCGNRKSHGDMTLQPGERVEKMVAEKYRDIPQLMPATVAAMRVRNVMIALSNSPAPALK